MTALNNDGTLLGNFAPPGSNFSEPFGVAIDAAGHVWMTNFFGRFGHSVTALNNDGTLFGYLLQGCSTFMSHWAWRSTARAMSGWRTFQAFSAIA